MFLRSVCCVVVVIVSVSCSEREVPQSPPNTPQSSPGGAAGAAAGRGELVGQAPSGAIVTLETVPPGESPPPAGPAVMDQYSRNFVPELLVVRVGQPVEFRNSEDIDHNVIVVRTPTGTRVFDTATPPYQKYEHTFDRAGRYDVSCDIHPGMRATIVATTSPHAVVVDQTGRFTFADLAPGSYKLTMTGGARTVERTIEVTGSRTDLGRLAP